MWNTVIRNPCSLLKDLIIGMCLTLNLTSRSTSHSDIFRSAILLDVSTSRERNLSVKLRLKSAAVDWTSEIRLDPCRCCQLDFRQDPCQCRSCCRQDFRLDLHRCRSCCQLDFSLDVQRRRSRLAFMILSFSG